jgi:hypothetical protein
MRFGAERACPAMDVDVVPGPVQDRHIGPMADDAFAGGSSDRSGFEDRAAILCTGTDSILTAS